MTTITVGHVYRFHRLCRPTNGESEWPDRNGLLYRVEDFVLNPITMQELVLYRGLEGDDEGRPFVCSQADFAQKFRHEPAAAVAEKVAGRAEVSGY